MIPARSGSERLKRKNYLHLSENITVLENAIVLAKRSNCFTDIYLNTDDKSLEFLARKYDIKFYLRKSELASSSSSSNDVVYDFCSQIKSDYLFWLNTTVPLLEIDDIQGFVARFIASGYDSAISGNNYYQHAMVNQKPINFDFERSFEKTQDLQPIFLFNYGLMSWKISKNINFKDKGLFSENTLTIETSKLTRVLLKNEDDYQIIKKLMK